MPSTNSEPSTPTSPWIYVAWGCGGCAALVLVGFTVASVVIAYYVRATLAPALSSLSSPAPSAASSTKPYSYAYGSACAKCTVPIPDGSGTITYMHVLGNGGGATYGEGERALRLRTKSPKVVDCPLLYFPNAKVRVGLYWYPRTNGKGPFIRTYDDTGAAIIDLNRGVTRLTERIGGRLYAGDWRNPNSYAGFGYVTTSGPGGGASVTRVTFDNKPADDVTATFGKSKGKYIGSIVRSGNSLTFVQAP